MPIDKFGHYIEKSARYQNQHFKIHLDSDRNFNFNLRRIKNIASPVLENDAVNKIYMKSYLSEIKKQLDTMYMERIKEMEDRFNEIIHQQNVLTTEKFDNVETRLSKLIHDQSIIPNNLNQSLKEMRSLFNYKIDSVEERLNEKTKLITNHLNIDI